MLRFYVLIFVPELLGFAFFSNTQFVKFIGKACNSPSFHVAVRYYPLSSLIVFQLLKLVVTCINDIHLIVCVYMYAALKRPTSDSLDSN